MPLGSAGQVANRFAACIGAVWGGLRGCVCLGVAGRHGWAPGATLRTPILSAKASRFMQAGPSSSRTPAPDQATSAACLRAPSARPTVPCAAAKQTACVAVRSGLCRGHGVSLVVVTMRAMPCSSSPLLFNSALSQTGALSESFTHRLIDRAKCVCSFSVVQAVDAIGMAGWQIGPAFNAVRGVKRCRRQGGPARTAPCHV